MHDNFTFKTYCTNFTSQIHRQMTSRENVNEKYSKCQQKETFSLHFFFAWKKRQHLFFDTKLFHFPLLCIYIWNSKFQPESMRSEQNEERSENCSTKGRNFEICDSFFFVWKFSTFSINFFLPHPSLVGLAGSHPRFPSYQTKLLYFE